MENALFSSTATVITHVVCSIHESFDVLPESYMELFKVITSRNLSNATLPYCVNALGKVDPVIQAAKVVLTCSSRSITLMMKPKHTSHGPVLAMSMAFCMAAAVVGYANPKVPVTSAPASCNTQPSWYCYSRQMFSDLLH